MIATLPSHAPWECGARYPSFHPKVTGSVLTYPAPIIESLPGKVPSRNALATLMQLLQIAQELALRATL